MRYEVKLKRQDKTELMGYIEASTEKEAQEKLMAVAKGIATGQQSLEVIKAGTPLNVVSVEPWGSCSSRVVSGENRYFVLVKALGGQVAELRIKAEGTKSAHNAALKQLGVKADSTVVFVYDVDQKTVQNAKSVAVQKKVVPKKHSCVECNEKFSTCQLKYIEGTTNYICVACIDKSDNYSVCKGCGKIFENDAMTDTRSMMPHGYMSDKSGYFCSDCITDKGVCAYCGVPHNSAEMVYDSRVDDEMQVCLECEVEVNDMHKR